LKTVSSFQLQAELVMRQKPLWINYELYTNNATHCQRFFESLLKKCSTF